MLQSGWTEKEQRLQLVSPSRGISKCVCEREPEKSREESHRAMRIKIIEEIMKLRSACLNATKKTCNLSSSDYCIE